MLIHMSSPPFRLSLAPAPRASLILAQLSQHQGDSPHSPSSQRRRRTDGGPGQIPHLQPVAAPQGSNCAWQRVDHGIKLY